MVRWDASENSDESKNDLVCRAIVPESQMLLSVMIEGLDS
jgi:hypothetical protein